MKTQPGTQSIGEYFGQSINIRTIIIGATLLLAWWLGLDPDWRYLGISIAIAASLVVIRYPALGVAGLLFGALVIPFAIGTGTQTSLPLSFIAVPVLWGLWFVGNIYYRRPIKPLASRITIALVGLAATATISLASGYLPWNAFAQLAPVRAQLGGWALFTFSAGTLLLTGLQIDSARWLKTLVLGFLAIASIYILGRTVPQIGQIREIVVDGATGSVFWIWLIALSAGQLLFNHQLGTRLKLVLVGIILATFYVSIADPTARSWASGWAPALVVLAILITLRWPRVTILLASLGAVAAIINYRLVGQLLLSGDNAYSLLTRRAALEILLTIIKSDPWLGIGPSNYYYYTPLYPILGWYVSFNSHNQYVDILAQVGIIGMFFYLWTFAELNILAIKLRTVVQSDGFMLGYVYACIAGSVGMLIAGMLGDWVIPFVYNVGVAGFRASVIGWVFLGGLLAVRRIYSDQGQAASSTETIS